MAITLRSTKGSPLTWDEGDDNFREVQTLMDKASFSPLDYGAYGNGVNDDSAAIQAAINAAESEITLAWEDVGSGYVVVDLNGKKYGVASGIVISKKIIFQNGALVALTAFPSGTNANSFVLSTIGYGATRCVIQNIEIDGGLDASENKYANGLWVYRAYRGKIYNVTVTHGREYTARISECQGLQVANCVFREYVVNDTGLSDTSYWTSKVLSVESADCVYSDINAGHGLYPLYVSSSANQFTNCHFVVATVTDASTGHIAAYIDTDLVTPKYAVGNIFTGCYFDGGEIRIKDSFYQIFSGCLFLRNSTAANTYGVNCLATQPNLTVQGLFLSGVFDGYSSTQQFVKTTSGSGSWSGVDALSWFAIKKAGTLTDQAMMFPGVYRKSDQFILDEESNGSVLISNRPISYTYNGSYYGAGYGSAIWSNTAYGSFFLGAKSRSTTVGAGGGFLSNNDEIVRFGGIADRGASNTFGGSTYSDVGGYMSIKADGAHSSSSTATKIEFYTTPTGSIANAVKRLEVNNAGKLISSGDLVIQPSSSVAALDTNGQVTFELTNNTTLTFKARGSDGTTRSGTVTLS